MEYERRQLACAALTAAVVPVTVVMPTELASGVVAHGPALSVLE
jgi:hypothetical protein